MHFAGIYTLDPSSCGRSSIDSRDTHIYKSYLVYTNKYNILPTLSIEKYSSTAAGDTNPFNTAIPLITLLGPQPRFGDELLGI